MDLAVERGLPLQNGQLFQVDYLNRMNVFLGVYPFNQEIKISLEVLLHN